MKKVSLHLQSLPVGTPHDEPLFLACNLNAWQPADERFRFLRKPDGTFLLDFDTPLDTLEFKITRGEWSKTEVLPGGGQLENRILKTALPENFAWIRVAAWSDFSKEKTACHTASENVQLLHPAFPMPQFEGRKRRVWAYLPPDYWVSKRRYPVIYMQDGQNLFDSCGSFSGEWGVDKALNRVWAFGDSGKSTLQTPIIIGVENGGEHRIEEYSAWKNPEHGGGDGEKYLGFLTETLKPFVDEHLRTLPGREHTGILGSSMGGLMSLLAAIERPDVFGMAGVFSPSIWFSRAEIFKTVKAQKPRFPVKILLMAGQRESDSMVADLLDLYETLLEAGHADEQLHYDLHSDGSHSEWFWAREFEHAFRWLFGDAESGHKHGAAASSANIKFKVDEKSKTLLVKIDPRLPRPILEIRDYCHNRQFRHPIKPGGTNIPYADWEHCLFSFRLLSEGDLVFSRRVFLNSPN